MSDILPSAILAIGTLVWLWRGTDFALRFSPPFPKRQAGRVPSPPRGLAGAGRMARGPSSRRQVVPAPKAVPWGRITWPGDDGSFERVSVYRSGSRPHHRRASEKASQGEQMRRLQHLRTHYYRAILFTFLRGLPLKHGSAKSTCQQPLTTVLNLRVRNG